MQSLTEKKRPKSSNDKEQIRIGRTAFLGLLLAFALILSYIETLISFQSGVPGIKLGLANLAVILSLYLFGWKEALLLTTLKALLSGLLFGNLFMILYSLAGAWLSCISMIFMKKSGWFHLPVISGFGGVMHNYCSGNCCKNIWSFILCTNSYYCRAGGRTCHWSSSFFCSALYSKYYVERNFL